MALLDDTDLKILELLQEDAMMTQTAIGAEVELHYSVVSRRIKWLKENAYILDSCATLNYQKLGYDIIYYDLVQLTEHSTATNADFKSAIRNNFPNVVECCKVSGTWDYILKVVAKNTADYNQISGALKDLPCVRMVRGFHATEQAVLCGIPLPTPPTGRDLQDDG